MRPLAEQVVLICGASRGIGAAVAKRFSAYRATLALHYNQSREKAEEVAQVCRTNGSQVWTVAADVKDREAVKCMVHSALQRWGRIDSVVYCSGISNSGLFQHMSEQDYEDVMNTHVRGLFYVLKAVAPYLLKQKQGRVVCLSSIWGSTGGAGEVLYSAAKGAVNGFVKALAKEWAPSGITVNAVAPGAIDTDMLDSLSREDREATVAAIPLDRLGTPEDVAFWVTHLCSPESGYMTGQILHVNGGWFTP